MWRNANMLVPVCQMPSNHLQIRTMTEVIPAPRMTNFLTDQMGVSAVQGCDACKMLSLQSAKEAPDKRRKETSDGSKDDGA